MRNNRIYKLVLGLTTLLVIALSGCVYEPLEEDLYTRNIYPITTNTYDIGSEDLAYDESHIYDMFTWDGANWVPVGAGTGDVVGTPPSTDHAIARYDGITGLLIQDSNVTIDDAGVISGGSLGIPTGRSVTFSVAASDSSATSIAQSDYQCSGADDEVEINAALNALPVLGGRVVLLEGTYTLADPIVIPKFNVTLEGQGTLPLIDGDGLATTEHAITVTSMDNVIIRNLSIQTDNGGGKDSSCILIDDGSDNFIIEGVTFIDSDTHAIVIGGTVLRVGRITNCHIVNGDEHGIYLDMDASTARYIAITGNVIEDVGGDGIRIWSTGSQDYFVINGNIISSVDGSAMYIQDLEGFTIADNNIENPTGYGMRFNNCHFGTISSNSFYNTGADGILTESSGDTTITGNDIDTTLIAGASDCIQVNGNSNTITSNYLKDPERNGVRVVGNENVVSGNDIIDADRDGIYVSGSENLISDNVITSAGRETAGTYDGVTLDGSSDRCSIVDNVITDGGTITENGVHVNDGATEVKVSDNYIFNLVGSGIVLVANNDDCQVTSNYVQQCDDYGVYIVAATCDNTLMIGNKLQGNVTAEYLDNGTDTGTFFQPVNLVGDGKVTLRLRPTVDQGKIGDKGKPTIVYYGIVRGWSLPIYALDEEVFFTVPHVWERWDEESDFTVHVHGYLDTANTDKRFRLQLTWEQNSGDDIYVNTSHEVEEETLTGTWAQYQGFEETFIIDYDIDTPDDVVSGDILSFRLLREDKTGIEAEIAGEVVITGIDIAFVANKLGKQP